MAEKTFEITEPSDHVTNEKTLSFANSVLRQTIFFSPFSSQNFQNFDYTYPPYQLSYKENTSFLSSDNDQFNKNSQLNSTFYNVNYFEKQPLVKESNHTINRVKEIKDKEVKDRKVKDKDQGM